MSDSSKCCKASAAVADSLDKLLAEQQKTNEILVALLQVMVDDEMGEDGLPGYHLDGTPIDHG